MSYIKFKRKDSMMGSEDVYISIRPSSIAFNAEFVKKADLKKYSRVTVYVDDENYKIGFRFHGNEKDSDSFKLYSDSVNKNTRNATIQQVMKTHKWIKSISELKNPIFKRFKPALNNIEKLWEINISPPFENRVSNISKIPSGLQGVYRYLKDKEIVYIGKGTIRSRANSPERLVWEFDTIEYSIIEDPEQQNIWESYWLDKFVEQNDRLPIYNKILGRK